MFICWYREFLIEKEEERTTLWLLMLGENFKPVALLEPEPLELIGLEEV